MSSARVHIVQFISVLLLCCAYFLSDTPDSLSVMHFNPNPAKHSVFTNHTKHTDGSKTGQTTVASKNDHHRKTNLPKHISFELIIPVVHVYHFTDPVPVVYSCPLPETYTYLFYEEINPPPPKAC